MGGDRREEGSQTVRGCFSSVLDEIQEMQMPQSSGPLAEAAAVFFIAAAVFLCGREEEFLIKFLLYMCVCVCTCVYLYQAPLKGPGRFMIELLFSIKMKIYSAALISAQTEGLFFKHTTSDIAAAVLSYVSAYCW